MNIGKEDLLTYVNCILELETQVYTLECAEKAIKDKIYELSNYTSVFPPEKERVYVQKEEGLPLISSIFGVIFGLLGIVAFFDALATKSAGILLFAFVVFGMEIACIAIPIKMRNDEYERRCAQAEADAEHRYMVEFEKYQRRLAQENAHAEYVIGQIQPDLEIIQHEKSKVANLLQQYYGLGIIHEMYRNIVPIASFAHYLSTGICSELEGVSGCYYIYEQEVTQKLIISKLDIVIEKLDELARQQYELKKALLKANERVKELTSYVHGIGEENAQHHAIMEYKQDQVLQESRFQSEYIRIKNFLSM